jgi:hypothetical protein
VPCDPGTLSGSYLKYAVAVARLDAGRGAVGRLPQFRAPIAEIGSRRGKGARDCPLRWLAVLWPKEPLDDEPLHLAVDPAASGSATKEPTIVIAFDVRTEVDDADLARIQLEIECQ